MKPEQEMLMWLNGTINNVQMSSDRREVYEVCRNRLLRYMGVDDGFNYRHDPSSNLSVNSGRQVSADHLFTDNSSLVCIDGTHFIKS